MWPPPRPLDAGEVLDAGKLKLIQWPVSVPLVGAFLKPQDLVGRSLLYPLAAGAPILDRDLAIPGTGLTTKIPDGMRALALRSDEVVGVAGFLFPGSHVDVLVTYRSDDRSRARHGDRLAKRRSAGCRQSGAAESGRQALERECSHRAGDAERCRAGGAGEYPGHDSFCAAQQWRSRPGGQCAPVGLAELIPGTGPAPVSARRAVRTGAIRRAAPDVVETVIGDKQSGVSF